MRKMLNVGLALALFLGLAVVGLFAAPAAYAAPAAHAAAAVPRISIPAEGLRNVIIQNRYSSKCLEMPFSTPNQYAEVGQYTCHGEPNQRWNFTPATGLLQNVNSGLCLSILGSFNFANGVVARQITCGVAPNGEGGIYQRWALWDDGSFYNIHTGKCLDLLGFNVNDFAPVGQWDCWGGPNQQWGFF
jgi:hypothetical protein